MCRVLSWTNLEAEVEEIFARLTVPRISRWGESGFRVYEPEPAPEWTPQRREYQRRRRGTKTYERCEVCRGPIDQRASGAGRQKKICGAPACVKAKQLEYSRKQAEKRKAQRSLNKEKHG